MVDHNTRYVIIDGETVVLDRCSDCPVCDHGDDGWGECCNYPVNPSKLKFGPRGYPWSWNSEPGFPDDCPLRVKEAEE